MNNEEHQKIVDRITALDEEAANLYRQRARVLKLAEIEMDKLFDANGDAK